MRQNLLITGGARSGKSRFAEELALRFGAPLCYLATAMAGDAEMEERIRIHRSRRGDAWQTVEETHAVPQALARLDGSFSAILLDCVTFWLSNLLLSRDDNDPERESAILADVHRLATTMRGMSTPVILVTNEVGMGIVPEPPLGRLFRDIAGQANQILAARCDETYLCVSGIPVKIK